MVYEVRCATLDGPTLTMKIVWADGRNEVKKYHSRASLWDAYLKFSRKHERIRQVVAKWN